MVERIKVSAWSKRGRTMVVKLSHLYGSAIPCFPCDETATRFVISFFILSRFEVCSVLLYVEMA